MAGGEAEHLRISPDEESHPMFAAVYRNVPRSGALTAFTFGLSHFHPPGIDAPVHRELVLSVQSRDIAWAMAAGFIAYQLREKCAFECGDTINFVEKISKKSRMSAFLIHHAHFIAPEARLIHLGERDIEIVQITPIFDEERRWFLSGGSSADFFAHFSALDLMAPDRIPYPGLDAPAPPAEKPWWKIW